MYIFIYIAVTLKFIYILANFCTFGFILKKCATITTDMHVSSKYVITKGMFDSHTSTIVTFHWDLPQLWLAH
jgi:hypothetical protein